MRKDAGHGISQVVARDAEATLSNCLSLENRRRALWKRAAIRAGLFMAAIAACSLAPLRAQAPNSSSPAPSTTKQRIRAPLWSPPSVDSRLSSVSKSPPCSLPDVLAQAGDREQDLVANFSRFSAHEKIQYDQLNAYGSTGTSATAANGTANTAYDWELNVSESTDYNYAVGLRELKGSFLVDESRQVSAGAKALTGVQQDQGLTSLALIFHPNYQGDYSMRCAGLADWDGTPAWVIYFVQRKDKPVRTRGFATSQKVFPEKLKGRAWFAKDSYQILHIDTNLVEPVIFQSGQTLESDAVSVDYGPVAFQAQNVQLWLPVSAATFTEVAGMRIIIKDTFSDFVLFSVQSNQAVEPPSQP